MKIVLLESDPQLIALIQERCTKSGVVLDIFQSAQAAFGAVRSNPDNVDVVLIAKEVAASANEGYVLAKKLRSDSRTAEVPFIIFSSKLTNADFAAHQKTDDGANAYLKKPLTLPVLLKTIEAVTGLKFPAEKKTVEIKKAPKAPMPGLNVVLVESRKILNLAEKIPPIPGIEMTLTLFADEQGVKAIESAEHTAPVATTKSTPDGTSSKSEDFEAVSASPPAIEASVSVDVPEPPVQSSGAPAEDASLTTNNATAGLSLELDSGNGGSVLELQLGSGSSNAPETSVPKEDSSKPAQNDPNEQPLEISMVGVEEPNNAEKGISQPKDAGPHEAVESPPPISMDIVADNNVTSQASNETAQEPKEQEPISGTLEGGASSSGSNASTTSEEDRAAQDLPYLFGSGGTSTLHTKNLSDRSIVGAKAALPDLSKLSLSGDGDMETMKKYLMMREQDIAILSAQLNYAKEELSKAEQSIKSLNRQIEDLMHGISERNQRIESLEKELLHSGKSKDSELEQIRFELKSKVDRIKFLEDQINASAIQHEKLRERVRNDIRKIRAREKELENKLEILKKDSETLIAGREARILELKRKIDLLEFNYDTLQDQNETEKLQVARAHEKIAKVVKVLKLAMGIIEGENTGAQGNNDDLDLGAA